MGSPAGLAGFHMQFEMLAKLIDKEANLSFKALGFGTDGLNKLPRCQTPGL